MMPLTSDPRGYLLLSYVGLAGIEPTASGPPDQRANQAALQPVIPGYLFSVATGSDSSG